MPGIKVRYVGIVRNIFGKQEEVIDLPEQATVRDLLGVLADIYGDDFQASVVAPDGNLRPMARLLLDGVDVEEAGGLQAGLKDVKQVSILVLEHPFTGG